MPSPTSRSLKNLRERGYICQIVEKFNMFSKKRIDLFGFIDILCIKEGEPGTLGVQTTTTGNINARITKAEALQEYHTYLTGNKVEFHGWSKKGAKGKRKTWQVKIIGKALSSNVNPQVQS